MAASQRPSLFQRLVGFVSAVSDFFAPAPPSPQDTAAAMERLIASYDDKVDALVDALEGGRLTAGQFVGSMPSLIKEHQLAAAIVAAGEPSPQVYAIAQRNVDEQLRYFNAWKAELLAQAAAGKLPSAEYIANRAKQYGKAANATASEAGIEAQGLPTLPFYPAKACQCHSNCHCAWDIKVLDVVNGNYDCFYTLAAVEHCPTCTARSRAANPLRVRRGEIVNADKYADARFYA